MKYPPIDDSWYHRLPGIPEEVSAGGVVVRLQPAQPEPQIYVALIREANAPFFVLPKGRLEPGESIQQAAHREIAEEAGLTNLTWLADLGTRERLSANKRRWKRVHYFLFSTTQIHADRQRLEQGNQLAWFLLHQLPDFYWPEQKALVDFNRQQIRAWLLGS